jgi:hypothetical protein
MCGLTHNVLRMELHRFRPLLTEMLMSACLLYIMPLVVTSSFNIQFITLCIMYTPPNPPPPAAHLCMNTVLMKRERCHTLFALKSNVSVQKGTPEFRVRGLLLPPPPSLGPRNIQQQHVSRMNKQVEPGSQPFLSARQVEICIPC